VIAGVCESCIEAVSIVLYVCQLTVLMNKLHYYDSVMHVS